MSCNYIVGSGKPNQLTQEVFHNDKLSSDAIKKFQQLALDNLAIDDQVRTLHMMSHLGVMICCRCDRDG